MALHGSKSVLGERKNTWIEVSITEAELFKIKMEVFARRIIPALQLS